MVRKPKALAQATDGKPDPAFQDLYIPRKEGDPTGQSQIINDQEDTLDYNLPTQAGQAAAETVTVAVAFIGEVLPEKIKLGATV